MGATGLLPSAPAYHMNLADMAESRVNDYRELVAHVRIQLPPALRKLILNIWVRSDAVMLAPRIVMIDTKDRIFETDLHDGLTLPPEFIALLNVTL
jgi:hypothetical protein